MRDLSNTKTVSTRKSSKVSAFYINSILSASIIFLGLVYLFSVNAMATEGLRIKQLTSQIAKLEDEHKSLELQNSALQSVSNIELQSQQLNFVPATNVTYLKDDNFALK